MNGEPTGEQAPAVPASEPGIALWQKVAAVVYAVVAVVLLIVFRSHLHEDFIPIDGSRVAPNILANVVVVVVMTPVGVLLWPPTRKRIERAAHRFATKHVDALKAHISRGHDELRAAQTEHHEARAREIRELADAIDGLHAAHSEHARKLDWLVQQTAGGDDGGSTTDKDPGSAA